MSPNSAGLKGSERGEGGAESVVTVLEPGEEWSEHMEVVEPLTALNEMYVPLG